MTTVVVHSTAVHHRQHVFHDVGLYYGGPVERTHPLVCQGRRHHRRNLGIDRHGTALEIEVDMVLELAWGRFSWVGVVFTHIIGQRQIAVRVVFL